MRSILPLLGLVLAGAAYTGGNPVLQVHRCIAANGALSYQQLPCAADAHESRVVELDLRAPPVPSTATATRPRSKARQEPSRRKTPHRSRARIGRAAPIPDCPATREHPGDSGLGSLKTAWKRHIELPSETYLKNAGRWPKRCIRR